jgi:hypothetical protein
VRPTVARPEADVSDRIVLTIPTEERFRAIATLVLGGVGSRADLPYERMDDFQLAVLSALEAADAGIVTIEIDAGDDGIVLALGPVRDGSGVDEGLGLVLSRLVDEVAHEHRDGSEWLSLRLAASPAAAA